MNLSEAIQFTIDNRESWNTGKGAVTSKINAKHCLRILGDIDVFTIETRHFTLLSRALLKEGKAKGTCNRITAALSTILKELSLNGYNIDVPSFKRQKESKGRREFYTEMEMLKIMEEAQKEPDFLLLHDSILFAYKTGCRQGEMLEMTTANVDLSSKEFVFYDTKNGEDHYLPIHEDLVPVIERRCHYATDGFLFPWQNSEQLLRRFKKVRDRLGISDAKVWHTIRHTVGTELVTKGVSLRVIMGILNHKNVNTTLRYAKAADTAKKEAIDLL